ncbi:MAG: nuclear transport factor 2 family protein [Erythrobacter sp.]|jgi:ketosteroid isomerase-like protein|nr:nuclear transport factor 2 family protein [Erythrobacter sp.]
MSTGYSSALATEHEAPPMRALTDKDHKNAHMLYAAHRAFQGGDVDALFSNIAKDAVWHMPGENALAGDYVGHEEIMRNFGMLQQAVDAYYAYPLDYYGSDDHVTLIAEVRARKGDKTLHTKEAMTWKVEGGKLKECWHMCLEPEKWDAFFSAD